MGLVSSAMQVVSHESSYIIDGIYWLFLQLSLVPFSCLASISRSILLSLLPPQSVLHFKETASGRRQLSGMQNVFRPDIQGRKYQFILQMAIAYSFSRF